MPIDLFAGYLLAVVLLVMVPGPVIALVVALGGARGAAAALFATLGASVSIALQLTAAALGLASLMALLGDLFAVLRWVCAAYLVYLAVKMWRAPVADEAPASISGASAFAQGFLVSSTNPKSLVFFAAFFPQFLNPEGPVALQLVLLCGTFQIVFSTGVAAYALGASRLRRVFASPRMARARNRTLSAVLGGSAAALALSALRR